MSDEIGKYLSAFSVALLTSLIVTPLARRAAIRFGILDQPGHRKLQADPVPYLGGFAIVVAFVAAMAVGGVVEGLSGGYTKLAVILAGALILAAMGLWDDLRPLPAWVKAVTILPLAVALYAGGVRATPFDAWGLNFLLTIASILGVVNALNFLDNMDGLTAGVSAIAAACFCALAALSGQFVVASLSAAVAGCSLGFLWFNREPARIFMGDMGSHFLGWMLAAIALELRFDNLPRVSLLVAIAVLGVPIFDTILISVSRIGRRLSPLQAGLDHTSHRLVRIGLGRGTVVGLHYLAAAACGVTGVIVSRTRPLTAYVIVGCVIVAGLILARLLLQVSAED